MKNNRYNSCIFGIVIGITMLAILSLAGNASAAIPINSCRSITGTLLGRVTFSGESPSGWQQANFTSPVAITANTTYIISYHTNAGYYSEDDNYFETSGVDNAPLHALQNGIDGGNGVYIYNNTNPTFPSNTYASANYWVDVVFTAAGG